MGWAATGLLLCAESLVPPVQVQILLCPCTLLAPRATRSPCSAWTSHCCVQTQPWPARPGARLPLLLGNRHPAARWGCGVWSKSLRETHLDIFFPDVNDSFPWSVGVLILPVPSLALLAVEGLSVQRSNSLPSFGPSSQRAGSGTEDGAMVQVPFLRDC